ncbi:chromosome transmission fidelity protein 18 homolog isoform X2 [Mangifera indica]|uniref:chromosome transmission fidelity protein 18 homolog isoform X2 n=1 Tax=Mangifera indica TaxID=29780 RepID=UPI001CF9F4D9|nr:chromosome transmission fidelity protein 18 homolog isoform X2 [Mangifera indica]
MDMDFDIPLPEELELLEANARFHDPYGDEDLDLDLEPPEQHPPDSPARQLTPHKRTRSESPSLPIDDNEPEFDDKRTKIVVNDDENNEKDEDWLRYSPPKESNGDVDEREDATDVVQEKVLSRYAFEIEGDCLPVTAPGGGDRVYVKICRAQGEEGVKKLDVKSYSNGLIPEPVNVLLQKMEQEAFAKALKSSSEDQTGISLPEKPLMHEQLWVDKYAPNSFTELLSDEQTNREVLLWLKQWDSCVFGSEVRSTSDDVLSALRRHSSIAHHKKITFPNFSRKFRGQRWSEGSFRHSNNLELENSNSKGIQDLWNKHTRLSGPPEQKILLLCGPPGLGKTTLAHVAAKHCGYRVVEVNASDDRSSSTIEAKILDVVQMDSVMADSRPKCLVIDEIDGALGDGKGAVEVILKMVSAERKSHAGKESVAKEEQSGRISSKKGRKATSLLRPVICICNDLYAPALRQLRQIAKVHVFIQPTLSRVVSRLKYICHKEGMKTSSMALTALAEYTECDIRSCLNTLQFLNKKKETLNMFEISSQVVGRKDMSRSAFDIWNEIFQRQKIKRLRKSINNFGSSSSEFDFLHSLISSRGDYDVILDGIHENILQLQYHDPVMQKTVKCLNYLGVSDLVHQYIMSTQQMSLYVYQPPLAITVHLLVAQIQKPNIEWPKSYQRYRTTLMEKRDIFNSWHCKIPPYISRHLTSKSFVEDSVSELLHILSPPTLRPVALHLLSDKEKTDLAQLVSTMVSYSITYKNVRFDPLPNNLGQDGGSDASALSLDPSITDFINFKGYRLVHHVLALPVKQVLVHEVEKQRIMQASIGKPVHKTDGQKGNQDLVGVETGKAGSTKVNHGPASSVIMGNAKNMSNPITCTISSTLDSSTSASTNLKLKCSGNMKKPSNGSFSFFDRFRKLNSSIPRINVIMICSR